jgi:hypothetical protein
MLNTRARLTALCAVFVIGACQSETVSAPAAPILPSAPSALLAPGEWNRTLVDTTDAAGNHTFVTEFAAGTFTGPDGAGESVASVTIKTVIPATAPTSSSGTCITSTIQAVETTSGWTSDVSKSGGCNKEIGIRFENRTTKQRADFSFLMIPGKTRIDAGAVR